MVNLNKKNKSFGKELIKVEITKKAHYKLECFFKLAKDEVGGLFEIEEIDDKTLRIVDTLIFEQEVTGGDFELDKDDLSDFTKKVFKKDITKLDKYKGWWHKHPIQGWSGQDDNTFERLCEFFGGMVIGLVKQGDGKILSRVDVENDKEFFSINTLNFKVIPDKKVDLKKIKKECGKLFEQKVKPKKYEPIKTINNLDGFGSIYQGHSIYNRHSNVIDIDISKDKPLEKYAKKKRVKNWLLYDKITDVINNIIGTHIDKLDECAQIYDCTRCPYNEVCSSFWGYGYAVNKNNNIDDKFMGGMYGY